MDQRKRQVGDVTHGKRIFDILISLEIGYLPKRKIEKKKTASKEVDKRKAANWICDKRKAESGMLGSSNTEKSKSGYNSFSPTRSTPDGSADYENEYDYEYEYGMK